MLISSKLLKESSEVSIKTRATPASLSFKGQATKHMTIKWSIICHCISVHSVKCVFAHFVSIYIPAFVLYSVHQKRTY